MKKTRLQQPEADPDHDPEAAAEPAGPVVHRSRCDESGRRLHPLAAAALSVIWPGLGHFGHRNRRAVVLAVTALAATALGLAYAFTRDMGDLLRLSVSTTTLWLLIAAALGLLAIRGAVAADAYRVAARSRPPRRVTVLRRLGTVAALAGLALLIAAPHLVLIRLAAAQLELLSEVFTASDTVAARPTPLPTVTGSTGSVSAIDGHTVPPAAGGAPEAGTSEIRVPDSPDPPDGGPATDAGAGGVAAKTGDDAGRLTIALLGSDGGYGRTGVRTDTIIVLTIDVATGDAAAFNIPRNWRRVTFPAGSAAADRWFDGFPGIANEIYGLGLRFPETFGDVEDPAGHAIKSALAHLTGLDVHYFVMADMVGFVKVIDLFGGIELQVDESIEDRIAPIAADGPSIAVRIEPGYHRLDGLTALGYVRSRAQSTDWHRMARQRCVIGALIDQVTPLEALSRFVALTGILSEHVTTDIPLDRLAELIEQADRLDTSRIVTVNFVPPEYPSTDAPLPRVRAAVDRALEGSRDAANESLADACG